MNKAQAFFKKIADANRSNSGGAFIEHGTYEDLEVKRVELRESENPETKGKMMFIVEFEVGTFTGGKYVNAVGQTVDTTGLYQRGSRISDVINLEDPYGMGLPRAKELTAAILAAKHGVAFEAAFDQVDEDDMASLCGPEQPGVGARLKCSAMHIITKKTKKDFTQRKYEPQHSAQKAA